MAARGISVSEFARIAETTDATVSRWRNRATPPAKPFRQRIIRRLKLTDEELRALGWPDAKEPAHG